MFSNLRGDILRNLYGKRLNKKQAEILEELFEVMEGLHKSVEVMGYDEFQDRQGLTDNYDNVFNGVDKLFIAFGYADKMLEDK